MSDTDSWVVVYLGGISDGPINTFKDKISLILETFIGPGVFAPFEPKVYCATILQAFLKESDSVVVDT